MSPPPVPSDVASAAPAPSEEPSVGSKRLVQALLGLLGSGGVASAAAVAAGVDPKVIAETITKFGVGPAMAGFFIYLLVKEVLPRADQRAERAEQRMAAMEAHHAATLTAQADTFRWAMGEQLKGMSRMEKVLEAQAVALEGVQKEIAGLVRRLDTTGPNPKVG